METLRLLVLDDRVAVVVLGGGRGTGDLHGVGPEGGDRQVVELLEDAAALDLQQGGQREGLPPSLAAVTRSIVASRAVRRSLTP